MEKGNLSINSENIFPIIKKWLYSDHDIFVRELVSNGCDAITKLKKLSMIGEADLGDNDKFAISIKLDSDEKTISFTDNGIGMTADEVKKYINDIAFSGATEFLDKYKDKANSDQIIGHFGLGFYSAFMVAHKVTIDTLSYKEGSAPVHWESEGGMEFEMSEGEKEERGTTVTLYLADDSYEFSNEYRVKEVLEKYCSFMPVEIFLGEPQFDTEDFEEDEEEKKTDGEVIDAEVGEDGKAKESDKKEEKKAAPKPVNDTNPLWNKHPNECKEEDYKEFYRKVFHDYKEPLFWIHLNMDYPFNLKGILYFPKINMEYETIEGTIKLYNNQVFIADNIKEVIPEFLMLLKGVIDCPDLPLNVSRSALQNDGFVKKISDYITKKVADKLSGMCKVDRENYEKYWDDIAPFIKFGCLKDEKFKEKMKDFIVYKDLENKYLTLKEYLEKGGKLGEEKAEKSTEAKSEEVGEAKQESTEEVKTEDSTEAKTEEKAEDTAETKAEEKTETKSDDKKEPEKKTVFYVTDAKQQAQYIDMFKEQKLDAVILTHNIDNPFIQMLENDNKDVKFVRIDADLSEALKEEGELSEDEVKEVTEVFKKALNNDKLEIKVEKLKNADISAVVTLSEEGRRMQDMMKMYGMAGMDDMYAAPETLVLNANNELVKSIIAHPKAKNTSLYCEQVYDLARLSNHPLKPDEMKKFMERSNKLMSMLATK
ncbi:MAG: molecular chaperone HtpG [Lachnospiraceae bacterium]|nr:molecular chaperone HtpG [Lachnospiraceae bacterium]